MQHWEGIRRKAREKRAEIERLSANESALSLLAAAEQASDIRCIAVPGDDSRLYGAEAFFNPETRKILYKQDLDPILVTLYRAHEFAHYWLGEGESACYEADLDLEVSEEQIPLGAERVEGYSQIGHQELQANVFAREFLLPAPALRRWFVDEHQDAKAIASRVGISAGLVFHQLAYALLTPQGQETSPHSANNDSPDDYRLDPHQRTAAEALSGPLLVEAGPGTGKTRTLIGRILHLLRTGKTTPNSILVLTFSNKAAEEMRERIAAVLPDQADYLQMQTFHAFGLELLRKYGYRLGLPSMPEVLDPVSGLFLLERLLPSLDLQYYQNLFDPALPLRDILQAISRAKDELCSPQHYLDLAEKMRTLASTPEEIEAAEKAIEVSHVYIVYQEHLDSKGILDFADLIAKSVKLLDEFSEVRQEVRTSYRDVLVDEYQDVNRACAILLRQIAGSGKGLWVVGDVRQSIYRFRGAAPYNMRAFSEDFLGGQTLPLLRNYRSQPPILRVLKCLAPQMRASSGMPFAPWENERTDTGGQVIFEIAENRLAEGKGLAGEIRRQHAAGFSFRDQAVLCRSHTDLARISGLLEQENIPVLYLGDLFERPEVRDLLALLSLACEGNGQGLLRVANFPQYNISLADVLELLRLAVDQNVPVLRALSIAGTSDAISAKGKQEFALLEHHLRGICYGTSAWSMLANYLFVRSGYLEPLLADPSYKGQQQRLGLYQFLQYTHTQDKVNTTGEDQKHPFLDMIRRLEILGEEKQLRQLPEAAVAIDAVRLMTVHASKGLQFRAVYLPFLGQGMFPSRRQPQPCPPPPGMITWASSSEHEEEEECLFFVALSRAKDVLCLSRAARYGERNSKPSSLLELVADALPKDIRGQPNWLGDGPAIPAITATPPPTKLPVYDREAVDLYLRCPRRYQYRYVYNLKGGGEDSAYLSFHRCLYEVLRWVEGSGDLEIEPSVLLERLDAVWKVRGPIGHPFESVYRKNAEAMIVNAYQKHLVVPQMVKNEVIEIPLEYGRVRFSPDHQEVQEDGTRTMRRARTGRIGSSEKDDDIYGLYHAAARAYELPVRIEVFSLATGELKTVSLTERTVSTRLAHYNDALRGIVENWFPAFPSDRECPRCPYYFICNGNDGE